MLYNIILCSICPLDVLVAAKNYRYSPGKIVAKLRSIKRLENKENKLKTSCEAFSNKQAKYKDRRACIFGCRDSGTDWT